MNSQTLALNSQHTLSCVVVVVVVELSSSCCCDVMIIIKTCIKMYFMSSVCHSGLFLNPYEYQSRSHRAPDTQHTFFVRRVTSRFLKNLGERCFPFTVLRSEVIDAKQHEERVQARHQVQSCDPCGQHNMSSMALYRRETSRVNQAYNEIDENWNVSDQKYDEQGSKDTQQFELGVGHCTRRSQLSFTCWSTS